MAGSPPFSFFSPLLSRGAKGERRESAGREKEEVVGWLALLLFSLLSPSLSIYLSLHLLAGSPPFSPLRSEERKKGECRDFLLLPPSSPPSLGKERGGKEGSPLHPSSLPPPSSLREGRERKEREGGLLLQPSSSLIAPPPPMQGKAAGLLVCCSGIYLRNPQENARNP